MKKIVELLPFIILTAIVPVCFYTDPNIAQSIIVTAIAGLSGYRFYLDSVVKTDYEQIFKERLEEINSNNKKELSVIKAELGTLRERHGIMVMDTNKKKSVTTPKW